MLVTKLADFSRMHYCTPFQDPGVGGVSVTSTSQVICCIGIKKRGIEISVSGIMLKPNCLIIDLMLKWAYTQTCTCTA